ncbi:MAG TPA: DUF4142 domain-containing protein [Micropepsaceae bacterium]|nr:DUF4142 domain-containing protein [Micropepsaceae bacterium]
MNRPYSPATDTRRLAWRGAFVACLVGGFFYLTSAANSAADVSSKPVHPAAPAQSAESRRFSEVERRAAAQEGLSERDKTFLMTATQSLMLQREVSRVATERTKNPAIRRFAEATVRFVDGAKKRLDKIAAEFGMSLPQIPPDQVQAAQQSLGKAGNPDREYLTGILADTTQVNNLYKDESSNATNPVVERYAQEMLPRLRQHYRNADNLLAGRR